MSPVNRHSSLFVYGTLRRGGKRHDVLGQVGAVYVGKGSVAGELFDLGSFPGAIPTDLPARVIGEVYRLPKLKPALKALDEYEGVGPGAVAASLFRRELAEVALENGERLSAWIYWLDHAPRRARRIESGDYAGPRRS